MKQRDKKDKSFCYFDSWIAMAEEKAIEKRGKVKMSNMGKKYKYCGANN